MTMYYETHGEGDPLVLILGLGSDVSQYAWMIEEFARTFRVIAFDNRGSGRTDRPREGYAIATMTDDLEGLLEALSIKDAHVLGISMGSRIALDLAVRYPDRVKDLILVSVLARRLTELKISNALRLAFASQWIPGLKRRYRQPWYAFAGQHAAALDYDSIRLSEKLSVPTLILHGKSDRTCSFRGAEELHEAIAGSRLVAFEGGHSFFRSVEREAFFASVIADTRTRN